jgi:low affinity Fe/Cu permease
MVAPSKTQAHHEAGKPAPRSDSASHIPDNQSKEAAVRPKSDWFHIFAAETARLSGKPPAFTLAVAIVVVWGVTGPLFGFSDTWQLVINTGTTIVTFLMVFLIQHTQNRDTLALQVKLAELIIAVHGAHNRLAAAEEMSEAELEALHEAYRARANETLDSLSRRRGSRE